MPNNLIKRNYLVIKYPSAEGYRNRYLTFERPDRLGSDIEIRRASKFDSIDNILAFIKECDLMTTSQYGSMFGLLKNENLEYVEVEEVISISTPTKIKFNKE